MCCHNLSPKKKTDPSLGPDTLHYALLWKLSHDSHRTLLFFNSLWEKACFCQAWKQTQIILLPKQWKDAALPFNKQTIALTCCLWKTYERQIKRRLRGDMGLWRQKIPKTSFFWKRRCWFLQLFLFLIYQVSNFMDEYLSHKSIDHVYADWSQL